MRVKYIILTGYYDCYVMQEVAWRAVVDKWRHRGGAGPPLHIGYVAVHARVIEVNEVASRDASREVYKDERHSTRWKL